MYSAFSGKDAVFSFVLHATLDPEHFSDNVILPIKPAMALELIPLLKKLDKILDSIMIITDDNGNIHKDFPTLTGELFDFFADYLYYLRMGTLRNQLGYFPGVIHTVFQYGYFNQFSGVK